MSALSPLTLFSRGLALALIALSLVACRSSQAASATESMPEPLAFSTLDAGQHSGLSHALFTVIDDQERWEELWRRHANRSLPKPPAPQVNWGRDMVIAVSLGPCPSAGYGIAIEGVSETAGALRVEALRTEPDPSSVQAAVITTPFHFVRTPRSTARAEFHLR